jgi:hypothetical protein
MRRALLTASVVVATGALAASGVASPELPRLLGFEGEKLVAVETATLRPAGSGLAVGSGGCASRSGGTACWTYPPWTVSPDGSTLAIARNDGARSLRIVDPTRLRVTSEIPVAAEVGALAWLSRGRILALQEAAGERLRLIVIDVPRRRVAVSRPLGGSVVDLQRAPRDVVLLLAPAGRIGAARLAVVNASGKVRFVRLERIVAGTKLLGTGARHRVDSRVPGFAVDPGRRRVLVVDPSVVAEIDLRTLKVAYHSLNRPRSLLVRPHASVEPLAEAKQVRGYYRVARWLGGDFLAFSGSDTADGRTQAAGLAIVDAREWTVRKIDVATTSFVTAGELLLASGGSAKGLIAYGFDGSERFRLFENEHAWPAQVYGGRAYVTVGAQGRLHVVDLAEGRVVEVRQEPLPWLLLGVGGGWWD